MPTTIPPERFDELTREIANRYDSFSKRLQQIARFALDHPNDLALETIAAIAQRAEVQPSAIIRFAKAMGFSGFSDMQRLFRDRLAEGRPSYSERIESLRESLGRRADDNPLLVLDAFIEANIIALNHLREEVDGALLQKAISLMSDVRQIYILAQRRAFSLATYFFYALNQLDVHSHLLDGVGGMLAEQTQKIGPDDLLIVASFTQYSPEVISVTRDAFKRGVPVIAITDRPLSPLVGCSTVCFQIEDAVVHDFRSLNASMCLAQSLAVSLGYHRQTSRLPRTSRHRAPRKSKRVGVV